MVTVVDDRRPASRAVAVSAAVWLPTIPTRAVLRCPCSSAGIRAPAATATSSSTEATQNDFALARSLISRLATSQVAAHQFVLIAASPSGRLPPDRR